VRGRKPTPTAFKLLRGNPGKRALPENEPEVPVAAPVPPPFLGPDAKAEWERIVPHLVTGGVLTEWDRAALTVYCVAFGDLAEAEAALRVQGKLVKSPTGYPIQNPNLAISNRAREVLAKMCPEFGMTPSSRSRVAGRKKDKPSKLSRFTKGYGT
jgi:P27 family predicted phage terminase small subunit